jgi:hypothetical protein
MKLTLAERMFEGVFDEQSDRNLNQMYNEIKELKMKYSMTFRSLIKTPFIKQMFEMIEDEYEYRNQMFEENNH